MSDLKQSATDEREAFEAASPPPAEAIWDEDLKRYLVDLYPGDVDEDYQARWEGWQARAAWQRAQSAPVVPEGWQLVPDGPTTEMRLAGNRAINEAGALLCGISLRQVYDAMLAAAPQPAGGRRP